MLPKNQQVAILTRIVEIIARYATNEPRIIPFRIAEGRSRYQLAEALEVANDLQGARKMHELASNAGLRTSTIVLRRWYLEGFAGTVRDHQRARELETLAVGQARLPTWPLEVRSRADSAVRSELEEVYFTEPGDDDPLANEMYRLARYKNAELTDAARKIAMNFYEFARSKNATVAKVLDATKNYFEQATDLPSTTVSVDVNRAREALEKKQVEEAYNLIAAAKGPMQNVATDPSTAMAWGVIADASAELARAPETVRDPELVARVHRLRDEVILDVLALHADGSSSRMRLAADLQRLANRAQETKDYDYAVKLHDRAITLRNLVFVRDLKNAECHCLIAGNYRSIGQIEKRRGNFDAAVVSYQRALLIYEDLERLEPDRGWNESVAATARDLAEVLGKRAESQSALMYAEMQLEKVATLPCGTARTPRPGSIMRSRLNLSRDMLVPLPILTNQAIASWRKTISNRLLQLSLRRTRPVKASSLWIPVRANADAK